MSKSKFKYNPKTLSYEKVERSLGERALRGFIFVAPTIVLSLIVGFFISYRIVSPGEKEAREELTQLKSQFKTVQERLVLVNKVTNAIKQRDEELYRTTLGADK